MEMRHSLSCTDKSVPLSLKAGGRYLLHCKCTEEIKELTALYTSKKNQFAQVLQHRENVD